MNLHKRSGRNTHLSRKKSKWFSWKPNLKVYQEGSDQSNIADRLSKIISGTKGKEGVIDEIDSMDEGKGLTEVI